MKTAINKNGAHRAALRPSFRAALQMDTLELTVYEEIGENWWTGDGVTAATVKQSLDENAVCSRISVRINSPGGDVFEGIAIYNLLRAQKKPVDVYVDGIAASAASVIAMAGDSITMGKAAMMMVHNAWTMCAGDARDMRKCADVLDAIGSAVGECYTAKTGKTAAEVQSIMDAETWMGAQECVDQGFATAVASEGDGAKAMALARSFKGTAKLRNLPEALRNDAADGDGDLCSCTCAVCMQL